MGNSTKGAMRTIKFRGIREEYNPDWHDSIFKFGNLLNSNSIGEVGCDIEHYTYAKVKPETIGQFTGLNDKNGREIYEGDVVKLHYFYEALGENLGVYEAENIITAVISIAPMGVWADGSTEEESGYLLWNNGLHEDSFEVIGNIHESKELL